jgi:hypothetical protein
MKHWYLICLALVCLIISLMAKSAAAESPTLDSQPGNAMPCQSDQKSVKGSFEVTMDPQKDSDVPARRMLIKKQYSGGLSGSGLGQMLSKRTESATAAYVAIEEFDGVLDAKRGSFTLLHSGLMTAESQSLEVNILQGSGGGKLETISDSLEIIQADGGHQYVLCYHL